MVANDNAVDAAGGGGGGAGLLLALVWCAAGRSLFSDRDGNGEKDRGKRMQILRRLNKWLLKFSKSLSPAVGSRTGGNGAFSDNQDQTRADKNEEWNISSTSGACRRACAAHRPRVKVARRQKDSRCRNVCREHTLGSK